MTLKLGMVGGGRGASYRALLGYTAPLSDSVSRHAGAALSCHSLTDLDDSMAGKIGK